MGTAFKLQNGQVLLSTEAPGGVYTPAQLRKIAELCDHDSALAKATEDQRLALFVAPEHVARIASALRSTGLGVRHYQDGLHQPVNCVGELCPEHQQDAMGAGMEIAAELAAIKLENPLKIGINGCARGCVATHTLDISVLGDSNGYRISLGGKNSQIPEMAAFMADGVPSAKLPKLIAKIVSIYKEIAEPGESLQEVIERHGAGKFIAALAPYSQDAHQDESTGGVGGLENFGEGEEVKLDDLGVPQHVNHDGPAIDVNLADVELMAEPSVDGITPTSGPAPALQDEEEVVAEHHEIEAESEIEPIQPLQAIEENSFEVVSEDVLVTPSSDEEEVVFESHTSDPVPVLEAHATDELHEDVDAVKLEAVSESLDEELDVTLDVVPTEDAHALEEHPVNEDHHHADDTAEDMASSADFDHEHDLEEVLIADDHDEAAHEAVHEAVHEDLGQEVAALEVAEVPKLPVAEVLTAEVEVEPEHLVADEAVIEEAHAEAAQEDAHSEVNSNEIPVAITEEIPAEVSVAEVHEEVPMAAISDAVPETALVSTEVNDVHTEVEASAETDEAANSLAANTVEALEDNVDAPAPDESLVPLDATPVISEPTIPTDLLATEEEADEFEDLSAEEIEAADTSFSDAADPLDDDVGEVDEASEDQLERNLEVEIEAEGNIPEVEDSNRDDRHEAMQLIAAQAEASPPPVVKAMEETKMATTNFPPRPAVESATQNSKAAGFDFIGLDFTADGRISLQFASGAVMAIDPWALVGATRRELRLAGKLIVLSPTEGGINVEVDGVAIFLPQRAAA